ncbi:MAG: SoxR reducing system RseC family protein [Bacteroidales bacterium]|nr:SoxR reducing system RseC family protein [Bacteroidales bacterium]
MTKAKGIKHTGTVQEIGNGYLRVKILAQAACTSCRANTFCGADTSEKIIEINSWEGDYSTGEKVNLHLQESHGAIALFWGYIAPFIVVVAALIIMLQITNNEGLSGLVSLLVLIPYYAVLYLFKDKFKKIFSFKISKLTN